MSYRKRFNDNIMLASEEDVDKIEFVESDTVKEILDDIESEINDICNLLRPIDGLAEIDEIKDKVEELSNKLY